MIDGDHGLSIAKQAKALGISRDSVYYSPKAVSPADLATMRRMDELHLDFPFASSRMLRDLLNRATAFTQSTCGNDHALIPSGLRGFGEWVGQSSRRSWWFWRCPSRGYGNPAD